MNRPPVHARALPAVLIAVLALVAGGLMAPASAATATGALKGTVTLNGKAVSFAKVQVYRYVYDFGNQEYEVADTKLKTVNTDSKGRYSFAGLATTSATSSKYVVAVTDRKQQGVKTYRIVALTTGRTLTKNVHLKAAAELHGTVSTQGRSPAGLTVGVDPGEYHDLGVSNEDLYPAFSTTVRADGSFSLAGIPATTYDEVVVSDGPYAQQCFELSSSTLADCDAVPFERRRVSLTAGEERLLPTVTATKFAPAVTKLTGRVTDTSGKALKGIRVRVVGGQVDRTVVTRSSGRYTLDAGIPAGSYDVRFDDPADVWASQYLGGGPDKTVRQKVVVTPGQPIKGLDTKLKSLSTAKIATRTGAGSAKVAFKIKRKATGSAPGGTVTLSFEGVSKTVPVTKGRATVTLTGIRTGALVLTAVYSGTGSTAGFSKPVKVLVG